MKGYLIGNSSLCIKSGQYIDLVSVNPCLPRLKEGFFNVMLKDGRYELIDAKWTTPLKTDH
nr:MAG TPA: hypothetical protein [Crassvirales sp.]